ncbi:spermatogenesis-associated protein 3 isoform X4 [Mus caroli]|uniref:Spermatogenesis-associated protein 3 isoform X4 n=1 Tax=Mus caroli TaxID=10089 RepID=A0A6P5PVV2_MUSCR|nr:spermatogenesis-associated protein 3 isoform X4 [Mus caroli]
MEQRPGEQPSRVPKKEKIEEQPETPSQSVSGRGRVLLIREFFKQDESYTTLPNTQATDCQNSCRSARQRLKRTRDSLADNPEAPAAKRAKMPQLSRLKKEDLLDCEKPWAPQGNPGSEAAEIAELSSEPGKQLLLVLCHASALDTQLPRLQLLLQQKTIKEVLRSP